MGFAFARAAPVVTVLVALTTGAVGTDPTLNTTVLTPAYFSSFHLSTWSVDIGDVSEPKSITFRWLSARQTPPVNPMPRRFGLSLTRASSRRGLSLSLSPFLSGPR